jgi:hypothetical protein
MSVKQKEGQVIPDKSRHILVNADVHEILRDKAFAARMPMSDLASTILRAGLTEAKPSRRKHAASA